MSDKQPESQGGGISPADVYFILFRQKWIILACALLGIAGAILILFVIKPPQYQSQALISIRYVVEGKSLNPPGDESNTRPLNERSASIINTEIALLHSLDLSKAVVRAMTPGRILAPAGGGTNFNRAVSMVSKGIIVDPIPESSVISITYQNPNAALVQPVLSEFIDAYLAEHARMHQGLGVPNQFLTNETVRLRAELAQTSDEIRKLKAAAGIISVEDTQKGYTEQISKIRQNLFSAEADLSEHQAMLGELVQSSSTAPEATNSSPIANVPPREVDRYKRICGQIAYLRKKEQDYLTQQGFTTENVLVKQNHELIVQDETLKKNLEVKYPGLATLGIPMSNPGNGLSQVGVIDLQAEAERVSALKAKIRTLNAQLKQVQTDAANFEKVKTSVSELEQKQSLEQANLKYLMSNLEGTQIVQALGTDKAANISVFQGPSLPSKGWSKSLKKKVLVVAAGGVFAGLALAFFIELIVDRSIKRPSEIETKLRLPVYVSIPDLAKNGHWGLGTGNRLLLQDAETNKDEAAGKRATRSNVSVNPGNRQHPLRRFYEGLRDRLVVHFEMKNVIHKPKLVGVTSCGKGAGVSSIATGLASSLSETGEGNVLLVDMHVDGGAPQHFRNGSPNHGLDSALKTETKENALAQNDLYIATEPMLDAELPQVLPKRLASLVSNVRSSDYDYIIFDMPPVAETTMTFRLARLMDMTLLVIEAGKTNQEVVKRAVSLLAESNANVSTVLNKTRNYVPRRLHQEYLHET